MAQEPRILSALSNDPVLVKSFVEGKDLYATLASTAYKLPYAQCTKDTKDGSVRRNHGKTLVLALSYGMQYKSLALQLNISDEEAKKLLSDFVEELHVAFEFGAKVRQFCKTNGYVKTLWGRKRRFPYYSGPQYKVVGDISPEVKRSIITRIKKAHYSQRFDLMKDLENRYSVKIMDYSMEMRKAETQILNSMIQGEQHRPYLLNPIT